MGRDVAQRVQHNAEVQQGEAPQTLAQMIEQMRPQIARALPKHMDPDRLARIALTVLRQTPQLARCNPQSFLGALMTSAQLGLEPGPLGEAYLVPYGNNVTFIPGYRGLVKLAWQSGQLKSIAAHTVHEHDEFDYAYGLDPVLHHKPALNGRGEVIAVYAVAVLKDGGSAFIVMSREDVDAIRKRSRASGNGPWVTDWDAMARKTAVRQLVRWLPLSSELHNLATAAALDESVRTGEDTTRDLDEVSPGFIDVTPVEQHEADPVDVTDSEVLDDEPPADELPVEEPPGGEESWPEVKAPGGRGRR
ncbi:recombinase RecT [Actinotalea sp. M2MS4P-6]|uniref:recombinase RecT n=1 Tax=Actinotalea sp. M2MS4P-6 TaxID=2983762 RepID=UPI0021E45678|nr:recombinase RecT [Actinotalea sp. M2MS4P-6]MCV2395958.1 recombinase RecT [Actinotalea sp. M2MS4P-6]